MVGVGQGLSRSNHLNALVLHEDVAVALCA